MHNMCCRIEFMKLLPFKPLLNLQTVKPTTSVTYLTVGELALLYGVHNQTIRRWCRAGSIAEHHRTIGNHRRFEAPNNEEAQTVGYVRVSSADQKSDLDVQALALTAKAKLQNIQINQTISDIGSGMNYKKKGFKQLMNMLLQGKVKHLVIMHRDRLLRFGAEIIFLICKIFNVKVTILEPSPATSPIEQLCLDMVEIITVFSSKIYGMRKNTNTKALNLANAQL
jgi:putative resolvase